ncbi:hypothetical protein ACVW00_000833 [Marmoricola sp. URHA0025 HA25]
MSNHVRPMLLGYVRADALGDLTGLARAEAELQAYADTEEFGLGTIYFEQGDESGAAFHALMAELGRDEAVRGVVVPDLRHLTVHEQLVLTRHADGARTAIFTARSPHAGGPGVVSPVVARPAVPPLRQDSAG